MLLDAFRSALCPILSALSGKAIRELVQHWLQDFLLKIRGNVGIIGVCLRISHDAVPSIIGLIDETALGC